MVDVTRMYIYGCVYLCVFVVRSIIGEFVYFMRQIFILSLLFDLSNKAIIIIPMLAMKISSRVCFE